MSVEEVFHLNKDTKVFIICNPNDMESMSGRRRVEQEFRKFGYDNISIQYYLTLDQINDSVRKLGLDLNVRKENVGVDGVYQWYTVANVLRKGRILGTHFIVAFPSSSLSKDIDRRQITKDIMYHNKDIGIFNVEGANKILNALQNFNVDRTLTKKSPIQIIRVFERTE